MHIDSLDYTPVELAFGTSGLRGLVTDMTDLECYINTLGFLRFIDSEEGRRETVYLAGDLRTSTPRIMRAVAAAVSSSGKKVVYCGLIPTPAIALYAQENDAPCVMVTGSHIPDDRNGIKFYKAGGEVLKADEAAIKNHVSIARESTYANLTGAFSSKGDLLNTATLPDIDIQAAALYKARFTNLLPSGLLSGKQIVLYQHSAVGRDLIADVLRSLGAEVITEGRSEKFIPIDTENVTNDDQRYFKELSGKYPNCMAIVSTDGDSDRPFLIDENGLFNRGDILGLVVADALRADYVAYPISSSDALDEYFESKSVPYLHTRIGSPHVIVAMNHAIIEGHQKTVGWEVNGGFLVGQDMEFLGHNLKKLPTRDALFPILIALWAAITQQRPVSALFSELPARYTQAGMIDDFPVEVSRLIVDAFSGDMAGVASNVERYFSKELGFGRLDKIDTTDGVRLYFSNGDIAHIRPSGNAPQLRIYSVAGSQERADRIVERSIAEPDGIYRIIEKEFNQS